MIRLAGAVALWTLSLAGVLLLYPFRHPEVPCAGLVGTAEMRAACEPVLAAANAQVFMFQTLPLLAFGALGYAVIALLEMRRRRRSGRAAASA